jgi:ribosomal protein S18 acetylase RimI-like enzyme
MLHRICVDARLRRRGVGRGTLLAAEGMMREMGAAAARLDTFCENLPAQRMYEGLGYRRAGQVRYDMGIFFFYEKAI